jgi:hypothetical protein
MKKINYLLLATGAIASCDDCSNNNKVNGIANLIFGKDNIIAGDSNAIKGKFNSINGNANVGLG